MTKQFDSLLQELLTEYDVGADYAGWSGSLKSDISKAPGKGYLIGDIASSLKISPEAVIDMISQSLFDKVFGKYPNNINPAKNEDQYRNSIKLALKEVVDELKEKNKNLSVRNADAIKGYTARIISQLGKAQKDYSGNKKAATLQDVKTAVETAVDGATPDSSDASETSDATTPKTTSVKAFKPSSQIDYTFETDVKAGTLNDEELRVYDAVDKGSSYDGRELLDYLKDEVKLDPREDLNINKLNRILTSLVSKGVLTGTAKAANDKDVEALEAPHQGDIDIERDAPEVKAAYDELIRSLDLRDY